MGVFEDITRNPKLLELAGSFGENLLERKRKNDFDEITSEYKNRLASLEKQRGSEFSVDALEQMNRANMDYVAAAAKISRDYEENAKKISKFYQDAADNTLRQYETVARIKDNEFQRLRTRQKEDVISSILDDPLYSEYRRLKRSLTASQLQGERGRRLAEMERQIMSKSDPNRVATVEASKLFDTIPLKEPNIAAWQTSIGLKREEKEELERIKSVAAIIGESANVNILLSNDEARAIRDDRRNLERVFKDKGINLTPDLNAQFGLLLQKDLASNQNRKTIAEMNNQARENAKRAEIEYKKLRDALNLTFKTNQSLAESLQPGNSRTIQTTAQSAAEMDLMLGTSPDAVKKNLVTTLSAKRGGIMQMFGQSPEELAEELVSRAKEVVESRGYKINTAPAVPAAPDSPASGGGAPSGVQGGVPSFKSITGGK